jgi:hypothetical protein
MTDRRMRAFVLALTEHIEYLTHPPIPPNHVWRCEYTEKLPICSKSGNKITSTCGQDESYTCIECHKTYFECTGCWNAKNNGYYDHRNICNKCGRTILVCYECFNKLKRVLDAYTCCLCWQGVCSEHFIPGACVDCGMPVRICHKKHSHYMSAEYVKCRSCGQHHTM